MHIQLRAIVPAGRSSIVRACACQFFRRGGGVKVGLLHKFVRFQKLHENTRPIVKHDMDMGSRPGGEQGVVRCQGAASFAPPASGAAAFAPPADSLRSSRPVY